MEREELSLCIEGNNDMKQRFYYLAMCTTILSHFILYAPYILKQNLYDGTGTAIIIALIVSSANAYMTIYVYNTYKNKNLLDINRILLGKFFGGFFSFINIIANLTISFFMYRGLIEVISRFMLTSTPSWIIAITLTLIFYVGLLNTNKSFLQFVGFISIFVMFSCIIYILLSMKSFHMYYAKAAFIHSFKTPKLITIGAASFFFTGVSHLALFNPEFKRLNFRGTLSIYIFIGVAVAILAVYLPAGMLGPYYMQKVLLTVMSASDTISVDLFIIERAAYILLPMVFLLGASDTIIWGYMGWGLTRTAIPNKKVNLGIFNIIIVLFAFLASRLKESTDVMEYGSIGISIALASHYLLFVILFIMTKIKEGRKA
ncbi:spore germination protein [Clostridium omnivorum]|nr:spore germination protein [Clostridium sp. E14]